MRILVTGATGFIGRTLVLRALRDERITEVVAPVRSEDKLLAQLVREGVGGCTQADHPRSRGAALGFPAYRTGRPRGPLRRRSLRPLARGIFPRQCRRHRAAAGHGARKPGCRGALFAIRRRTDARRASQQKTRSSRPSYFVVWRVQAADGTGRAASGSWTCPLPARPHGAGPGRPGHTPALPHGPREAVDETRTRVEAFQLGVVR